MTQNQDANNQAGRGVRWYHALVAGLMHAAFMLLAFPPISLFGLSFLAPVPLLWIAWKSQNPYKQGVFAAAGVLPFYAYQLDYVFHITAAGYIPLLLHLAMWPGLFVWIAGTVRKRFEKLPAVLLLPVVWVGLETIRGEVLWGGFEWYQVGQPLIAFPAVASIASLGGGYLLTLVLVLLGCLLLEVRSNSQLKKPAILVSTVLVVAVWGVSLLTLPRVSTDGESSVRISLVQTDVPQDNKVAWTPEQRMMDYQNFANLSIKAAGDRPDLIVWPETMFPGPALDEAGAMAINRDGYNEANNIRDHFLALQSELRVPMLVGAITATNIRIDQQGRQSQDATYNSAYLVRNGQVRADRYDKIAPTPFGETLPYIKSVPWLQNLVLKIGLGASGMDFGLDAGTKAAPIEIETESGVIRAATPICFESSQSRICRRIANSGPGADLMIVMTNDGWFGDSDHGRAMHVLLARWRCLELGLPMARVANTGQSCFIDAKGRVTDILPPQEAGVLTGQVRLDAGLSRTPYRTVGNLVGWAALAGMLALLAGAIIKRIKDKPAGDTKRES